MVNTQLLDDVIIKSGKKRGYLAEKCGLTRQGFNKKKNGQSEFNASEIIILCEELGITSLTAKERIFFAKKVSENGNTEGD